MANPNSTGGPPATDGRTAQAGRYTLLMPGNPAYYSRAGDLQQKWKTFCGSLQTQVVTIQGQVQRTEQDLKNASTTLHNSDTDSLTSADIWLVLSDVVPPGGGSSNLNLTPPPGP
ncbi:hypothetical protein ABH930_000233 [Kitasatospora sp. GAS204A]|uniref:hypothetical protein n=1 Tax=unclassified Kitasatospora TaxID=2633591 RepID=UPI002473C998|nr:hypothetical protein [Kitasatospora sp. GAS204B]MDH6116814.1 hypothetical protein [Kitasatospora sp. GAS204B]